MTSAPGAEGKSPRALRAFAGDLAPRDVQDLMVYPWFSLAKTKRVQPIHFRSGDLTIQVEGTTQHGIATIWDADVLIWAASQVIEARDLALPTSRLLVATPYEVLRFIRRGTSARDYARLKGALDRLQATTIATSIRQPLSKRLHRFSWINEWKERATGLGRVMGIEMILPDWFYAAVLDATLVLTIDRAYFDLTGGIERWLYRIVRKHAGRQPTGWRFDLRQLHVKSGSLAPLPRFAFEIRDIVIRQALPGYHLVLERTTDGEEFIDCRPRSKAVMRRLITQLASRRGSGDKL